MYRKMQDDASSSHAGMLRLSGSDVERQDPHTEPETREPHEKKLPADALLWRALRRPFALTPEMRHVHKCQWEKIDMGILGCKLCSAIHICSIDSCPSTQSNDATVCTLSGLCLTNKNFVQDDYSDRVAPYIFCASNRTAQRAVTPEQIREMAVYLLLSKQAETAFNIEVRRRAQRMTNSLALTLEDRSACAGANVIRLLEQTQRNFTQQNKLLCDFHPDIRKNVIERVVTSVSHIINTCQWQWLRNIKPMELRMYVVGLIYLMRSGVCICRIQVIPCIPLLVYLLPTENLLETTFAFKSKHVTDIENKFKFFFRQMSHETLLKLGLHTQA
jgi:hypothetical protein